MQISTCFLVVCAVGYSTIVLPLHAADADTDAKLREALEKKLNELQSQPYTAAPQPGVTTPSPKTSPAPATAPTPSAVPSDSESAARQREALRQKMNELQIQPGGRPVPPGQWSPPAVAKPAPSAAKPAAPAPAVKPAPAPAVRATAASADQPVPALVAQAAPAPALNVPPAADPETIAKARAALRQKMSELQGQPGFQPVPAQPAPGPAPAPTPAPAVAQPAPAVQATPQPGVTAPAPVSEDTIAKAREALRQKMNQLEAESPTPAIAPAPAPAPAVAAPAPAVKPAPATPPATAAAAPAPQPKPEKISKKPGKGPLSFPPIAGPGPAVSADKEARLAELLRKYKADEITPEEYHQQRAKILSEP